MMPELSVVVRKERFSRPLGAAISFKMVGSYVEALNVDGRIERQLHSKTFRCTTKKANDSNGSFSPIQ
jgi:hypothetical protein